jgi:CubicO group peptidase (beta-lactamase class C family)
VTAPPKPVFDPTKLAEMDDAVQQAIADKMLPGGVLWVERNGAAYYKAYGKRALLPTEEPMTDDTIFDAASLTKVLATTPAIMLLVERGQVTLDEPLATYLREFKGNGKDAITIRQLLTHTSGLRPDLDTKPPWSGYETAIRLACAEKLAAPPGTAFRYSDINFFLLGDVVRRVSGQKLNEFVAREIYTPLGMRDTGYLPPPDKLARVAPTEKVGDAILRGTVHDPTARYMGGVAGHAGTFTTAADLARFARMMLNEGELDGVRLFKPDTVRLMTRVQTPDSVPA